MSSKYYIYWSEEKGVSYSLIVNSLIKAFVKVYGVREFKIVWNKFSIRGTHFIDSMKNYDHSFFYMLSCFLTPKKINKVYRILIKDSK